MSQRIRIKLKSYDYNLVDKSAEKIVKTVKATGAVVSGPAPAPLSWFKLALSRDGHLVIDTSQPIKADKYLVV